MLSREPEKINDFEMEFLWASELFCADGKFMTR